MISKSLDFTQPGGFPMTQERLKFLQTAWTETIEQLAGTGVTGGAPTVLSGMVSAAPIGGVVSVSAGWFVYNGNIVQFTGDLSGATATAQTYASPVAGGHAVYVVITTTSTPCPAPFNNASTPNVINVVTGVLTTLVNTTATDATHFLLSAIVPFNNALTAAISNINSELAAAVPVTTVSAATGITVNTVNTGNNNYVYSTANALSGAVINLNPSGFGPLPGVEYVFMSSITAGQTVNVVPAAGVSVNFVVSPAALVYTAGNSTYVIVRITYLGHVGGFFYYLSEFLNPAV